MINWSTEGLPSVPFELESVLLKWQVCVDDSRIEKLLLRLVTMEWSVSGNYRALHHWLQCHQVVTCPVWSANNVSCHQHLGSESCQQWMFWSLYPEQQRGIVWECYSCRAVEIALKLTFLASHQCSADPYLTQTSLRKSPSQDIIAWYGIKPLHSELEATALDTQSDGNCFCHDLMNESWRNLQLMFPCLYDVAWLGLWWMFVIEPDTLTQHKVSPSIVFSLHSPPFLHFTPAAAVSHDQHNQAVLDSDDLLEMNNKPLDKAAKVPDDDHADQATHKLTFLNTIRCKNSDQLLLKHYKQPLFAACSSNVASFII